ncbi:DHH family phosphoesterase [archaeon]|nr:DHH family phosphoesterase [archaeon]PJC45461.1 MAG: hypothetical protein CO037_01400 [Candidatus Pacearchaeota archaeon CG_4_9_14_0_2_um_filter_30_8]
MLDKEEILKVREHLEKAQSPLFYFDNDQDGLCSYLLLRRFYNKGNGVPVKTSPLGMEYIRRIDEFYPDYVFILDQPTVSNEFFEAIRQKNIPIVWIDHHEVDKDSLPDYVNYFNPLYSSKKSSEPVTKICYEITKRKEDLWISIAGCLSDKFFPKEYNEFSKLYPDLSLDSKDPFKLFYESGIGKLSRMIGMGLKDRTSLVMKMIRFLIQARTPYEVLEEKSENINLHRRFNEINSKLQKLVNKAKSEITLSKLLFFKYSGDTSMSSDLSNKLSYEIPEKFIVVAFLRGSRVNISIRGKNAKKTIKKAIKEFSLAKFGGHKDAVGAQMNEDELDKFKENIEKILDQKS